MAQANSDTIAYLINSAFDQSYQDAFSALKTALEHITNPQLQMVAGDRLKLSEFYGPTGVLQDRFCNLEDSLRSVLICSMFENDRDPRLDKGLQRTKDHYAGEAKIILDIIGENLSEWIDDPLMHEAAKGHITLLHERVETATKILDIIIKNRSQALNTSDSKPSKPGHTP